MEYTKGPWTLKDTGGEFFIPETNISFLRSHSTHKKEDEGIRKSEQGQIEQANARLMVAAPEMYEALKGLLDWHDNQIGGSMLEKRIEMARQALSKAEGRTD